MFPFLFYLVTHKINKSFFFLTYQVFAHILRLHPACEVTEGAMELVHHYFNLRQDGLKFWLLCNDSNNSKKICAYLRTADNNE